MNLPIMQRLPALVRLRLHFLHHTRLHLVPQIRVGVKLLHLGDQVQLNLLAISFPSSVVLFYISFTNCSISTMPKSQLAF